MSSPIVLVPAYGRRYETKEAMIFDLNLGKDFKIFAGPYCSVRDFEGKSLSLLFKPGYYIAGKVFKGVFITI